MFQPPHIAVLLCTALLTVLACRWARSARQSAVKRWLQAAAVAVLLFDPAYWVWEMGSFGHIDPATSLPLYLCSLFWLLLPIAVFAKRDWLRQMASATVCTMGLLGGVFGLVFNIYLSRYPFLSFVPVRSLLYHMLMVLVPAVMWSSGRYRPRREDRYRCFVPVAALVVVCLVFNRLFGWDYCYTAGGLGTPLEKLSGVLPRGLFLLVLYGALLGLIQLLFYRRIPGDGAGETDCTEDGENTQKDF